MFSGEDRTRLGGLDPRGGHHRRVRLPRHRLVTMLQFKSRPPCATGFFYSACRSMTSGRRLRAVLVTRPVGFCIGRRPIGVGVTEAFSHRRRRAVVPSVLVKLGSRGDLDGGRSEQRRTENCQEYLSHRKSPPSVRLRDKRRPAPRRLVLQVTIADANYEDPANHEAASKIVVKGTLSANYSRGEP